MVDLDERNESHDEFHMSLRSKSAVNASGIQTHGEPGSAERPSARGRAQCNCMNS